MQRPLEPTRNEASSMSSAAVLAAAKRKGPEPVPLVCDEHFLESYRALLDSEDLAFDELEHASEDGNRPLFEAQYTAWTEAVTARLHFLTMHGIAVGAQVLPAARFL
jgi:hypothetical protein